MTQTEFMKIMQTMLTASLCMFALCGLAKGQDSCRHWASHIDPSIRPDETEAIDHRDPAMIIKGIECLLKMEGNQKLASISGATRNETSQIFERARVEVAALF